ncbi:MAG: hypothetical protein QOC96_1030 [Acidobacteriota bacterium]|jgi:hypothetical protein|nr:hypothetical protein [Acidobacteriota bacterium]
MKKVIQLFVLAALAMTLALPVLAQTPATASVAVAASGQDDTEAKAALYKQFTDNIKRDPNAKPEVAYQAGKDYLAKYEAKDGPDDQYIKYIKKWVDTYEKIARRTALLQQLKDKKYNEAFAAAKPVLVDFPDDLAVLYQLSGAGLDAATTGNEANNTDTVSYAKRTIQLIQSGKSFDPSKPLAAKDRDEILGNLNYALGFLLRKSAPSEVETYFVNAAQFDGPQKKNPYNYYLLASAYEEAEYTKLRADYEAKCKTDEQLKGQECKDLTDKVNQVVDHMIDALARAIAYSNSSPDAAKFAKERTAWTEQITSLYKYRNNNSETGLKELIAGITARPLPKPGEPITPSLIPSAPSSMATPVQSGSPTASSTKTTTTTPASTKQSTTSTTQSNGKTTGKTSSTKTTPKRSHY